MPKGINEPFLSLLSYKDELHQFGNARWSNLQISNSLPGYPNTTWYDQEMWRNGPV